ncbi:reverse transcriptase domain-containing protein [Tanacetum coccineum]
MEIEKVAVFLDSQLLVNQIKGTFAAKQASIKDYLQKVKTAPRGFEDYIVEHVRRNQNKKADALSKLASMTFEHLTKEVLVEVLTKRLFPEDTREARKIRIQAPQYKLIRGNLYKRSFFTPWLRCVALPQTDKIIKEIHEGFCGFNAKPRSLVVKIMKQGFYWASMHREVAKSIQDCEKCKEESAIRKAITSGAIAAGSTWPFSHWGIHIIGPLPMALGDSETLPRNREKETPFSLTYGSEAVIPIIKTTDDRGRVQKATKGKEGKEVTSIEKAYYRNKLRKYHNARSSHPTYIVGDFALLKRNVNEWEGSYIINDIHKEELYIIVDVADQSLVQTAKGTSLRKFYM